MAKRNGANEHLMTSLKVYAMKDACQAGRTQLLYLEVHVDQKPMACSTSASGTSDDWIEAESVLQS